jgi:hypothetical protein
MKTPSGMVPLDETMETPIGMVPQEETMETPSGMVLLEETMETPSGMILLEETMESPSGMVGKKAHTPKSLEYTLQMLSYYKCYDYDLSNIYIASMNLQLSCSKTIL